jgi:hypothetical protein
MPTFKQIKEATDGFQKGIAESGHAAVLSFGRTLTNIGARLAAPDEQKEEPDEILADAIVGAARAHVTFREGALDAASGAVKALRKQKP